MKQFGICQVDDKKKRRGVGAMEIGALLALGASLITAAPLQALPTTSPSVRAAARFKNRPPAGWIRHYLPDDRYKIKGGSWKYVSTELDTYYHRPDSALMLRQSPNGVIGFNSAADAEEAGYRPAPNTNPDYSKFSYDPKPEAVVPTENMSAPGGMGAMGGAGNPMAGFGSMGDILTGPNGKTLAVSVNRTNKARRVALGDGRSSVVLPPGWGRAPVPAEMVNAEIPDAQKMGMQIDVLVPPGTRGKSGLFVISATIPDLPPGFDMSMIFQPRSFRGLGMTGGGRSRSGRAMPKGSNPMGMGMDNVRPTTLGGLPGLAITPPAGQDARHVGTMIMTGRSNKIYVMGMIGLSRRTSGVSTILNSYRPR